MKSNILDTMRRIGPYCIVTDVDTEYETTIIVRDNGAEGFSVVDHHRQALEKMSVVSLTPENFQAAILRTQELYRILTVTMANVRNRGICPDCGTKLHVRDGHVCADGEWK